MLEVLEKEKKETAKEYAVRILKYNIMNLNLKPGQIVSENEIAQQLGISRTPVREAFIELSKASMVDIYPQKGTYIAPINLGIIEQSRFMRAVLERAVIEIDCDNSNKTYIAYLEENLMLQQSCAEQKDYKRLLYLDNEFHRLLFSMAGKEAIYDFMENIMGHFNRARMLNLAEMDRQRTIDEHKRMFEFIKAKDKKGASALMEQHLSRINTDLAYLQERHPEYFKNS
ncbi:GntR family transcriptional regulator [Mahella sp.]|uniref:GntR family transcriptional regulator n=1 Tax=Mahella sp. TaxID=2798721 RepID=UPI0025BCA972|nr:GntR family transcriptional regulator [Mahella sp.]MBZ4665631.1 transcriptional regulator, GntR family [Mahella sp.]